jgi:hypothetical protein
MAHSLKLGLVVALATLIGRVELMARRHHQSPTVIARPGGPVVFAAIMTHP